MREQLRFFASPTGLIVTAGAAMVAAGVGRCRGSLNGLMAGLACATVASGLLRRSDQADAVLRGRVVALEETTGSASARGLSLHQVIRVLEASADDLGASIDDLSVRLAQTTEDISAAAHRVDMTDRFARGQTERIVDRVREAEVRLGAMGKRLERLAGISGMTHDRDLDDEAISELLDYWNPRLGTLTSHRSVRHLLLRAHHAERACRGRLATHSADIVIRSLAVDSAPGEEVDILEIGTLFGIGGLIVRDHVEGRGRRARLTVLDPLSGYYGENQLDPPTELVVSHANLLHNAKHFGVSTGDLVVLEGLSTDGAIRNRAAERTYGALIIDGDHSYAGVKADYEFYADLVVPGGVLIVDDYGTPDWPDVGRYTDEAIVPDPRFEMVGAASRTAVFRRR